MRGEWNRGRRNCNHDYFVQEGATDSDYLQRIDTHKKFKVNHKKIQCIVSEQLEGGKKKPQKTKRGIRTKASKILIKDREGTKQTRKQKGWYAWHAS